MFKFLKDKLKKAVNKFSKDVDETAENIVEEIEISTPKKKEKTVGKKETNKKINSKKKKIEIKEINNKEVKQKVTTVKKEKTENSSFKSASEKVVKTKKKSIIPIKEDVEESTKSNKIVSEYVEEEKPKKKGFLSKLFGKKEDSLENVNYGDSKINTIDEENTEEENKKLDEHTEKIVEVKAELTSSVEKDIEYNNSKTNLENNIEEKDGVEENREEEPIKKGFFQKIKETVVSKKLSESKFDDLFFELEIVLLENNVALEVIEKIKEDLKKGLVDQKINRFEIENTVITQLKNSINEILSFEVPNFLEVIKKKKPYIVLLLGINGSGKTTTIAKLAQLCKDNNLSSVLVAGDTFRAAAIQQLEEHAKNLDIKIIKQNYGSDPAAVAFDGIKYAEAKKLDVVFIDTAGRLHSNTNLMDELKKVIRVSKPDYKIFIGESITGNDCVEQANKFNDAVEIDGIILSKADVDEKGGAAISVTYVTGKPILFLGTGQNYSDLEIFNKNKILDQLFD